MLSLIPKMKETTMFFEQECNQKVFYKIAKQMREPFDNTLD